MYFLASTKTWGWLTPDRGGTRGREGVRGEGERQPPGTDADVGHQRDRRRAGQGAESRGCAGAGLLSVLRQAVPESGLGREWGIFP